jgi:hypothetical protein
MSIVARPRDARKRAKPNGKPRKCQGRLFGVNYFFAWLPNTHRGVEK